jgi:hypothetical protein
MKPLLDRRFARGKTAVEFLANSLTTMMIRITFPWYNPLPVKTKSMGEFNIKFASMPYDHSSGVYIAAVPSKNQGKPDASLLPVCRLSDLFKTQEQAIRAWETGFAVRSLSEAETSDVAAAVITMMLKKKHAEGVAA